MTSTLPTIRALSTLRRFPPASSSGMSAQMSAPIAVRRSKPRLSQSGRNRTPQEMTIVVSSLATRSATSAMRKHIPRTFRTT